MKPPSHSSSTAVNIGSDEDLYDYASTGADLGSEHNIVQSAKRTLSDNLANPPPLSELALALGVTERRLVDVFRQQLGVSVFEFVRQERMRKAKRFLTQTSLSILTIAQELGFSTAANFSTAFREYVGVPPSTFRAEATFESLTATEGALTWDSLPRRD